MCYDAVQMMTYPDCFQQTSERRQMALTEYLRELLSLGPHISESDVVYTFLHCLLRDEQGLRKMREGRNCCLVMERVVTGVAVCCYGNCWCGSGR